MTADDVDDVDDDGCDDGDGDGDCGDGCVGVGDGGDEWWLRR